MFITHPKKVFVTLLKKVFVTHFKKVFITLLFLKFLGSNVFSQVISEVLFNYPHERENCQYIEIYNNLNQTIDLRNFKFTVQGYEIKITNIFLGDFETEGITNSFLLNPGQTAVILPYFYVQSSKPFYFPSNTLILTTSTKYLANTTPLNYDILTSIKLISNDQVIDYISSVQHQNQGISLVRYNNNFFLTDKPSFGFIEADKHLWLSKYVYHPKDAVEIFLRIETNVNTVQLELLGKGYITLSKVSENLFKGTVTFYQNGEKIVAKFHDIVTSARCIDLFEISREMSEKMLLNEICFSPTKRWFDFFLGNPLVGPTTEKDKYIEIVNLHSQDLPITNVYIHAMNESKEIMINLKENVFYSSLRGIVSNIDSIKPYEYLLISSPGITSNMCFTLKDNHPYKGGKIVHLAEEKNLKIIPFTHSNSFTLYNKPTVSVLPNAFPNRLGGKFLNWRETPARYNGFQEPTIILDSKFKKINSKISIYLISEILENTVIPLKVTTKNSRISRNINLTNLGLWYFGEFEISNSPNAVIYVEANDEVTIEYNYGTQRFLETFFVIPENALQISKDGEVVMEKSVIKRRETIRFINTKKGDRIKFFSKDGNFIRELTVENEKVQEVDSSFLTKGIYIIQYQKGKTTSILKLVILE